MVYIPKILRLLATLEAKKISILFVNFDSRQRHTLELFLFILISIKHGFNDSNLRNFYYDFIAKLVSGSFLELLHNGMINFRSFNSESYLMLPIDMLIPILLLK